MDKRDPLGLNRLIAERPKKKRHFSPTPNTRLSRKNKQILMNGLQKNAKNLHFWPKWPILDSFWPKWAKREFFQKKRLEYFSRA